MGAEAVDPSLRRSYVGGPRDGLLTAELPAALSGQKLTGVVSSIPLSHPAEFSLHAVYECVSDSQIAAQ